jgi:long-chain fatty acid transport protein
MTSSRSKITLPAAASILALLAGITAAAPAAATNGMYLVGYGPETVARGGANLAISDRTLALNFNPAGISQLQGNHFSVSLSTLAPSLEEENGLNDLTGAKDRLFFLPAFAYVRSGKDTKWSWGAGFLAQGGMGATFEDVNTPFGTRDDTDSEVRFATLSPTVSYAFSDDMALGLTLNVGYADASFRFFNDTSFFNPQNPQQSFFGLNMKKAGGLTTNARLGWWWRAHPRLAVGAVYQTETDSNFEDGDMWVNFEGHPFLGDRVRYSANMDGFTFASQAGVGFALRPADRWVVALDVKRYFWDDAIDTITVTATNPEVEGAPPEITVPFVFNWKDQWVFAVGADYRLNDVLTLRAGYNYGQNPVPDNTLNPLFPATTERHATFGFAWLLRNKLIEFGIERAFSSDHTNFNPDPQVNPFGPGSRVLHDQWTASFGVSWAWSRKNGPTAGR